MLANRTTRLLLCGLAVALVTIERGGAFAVAQPAINEEGRKLKEFNDRVLKYVDHQTNVKCKLWNMEGHRYYTYSRKNVRFFVLDSDYLDPDQLQWIEQQLKDAKSDWKICYFHHPLYSDGGRHGSEVDLRVILEPLFVKYGVNAVYSGHDHIYERVKPQKGVYYFVSGSAGQLRKGNLRRSAMTAAGYDEDQSFMLNEIDGDDLFFQVISRTGRTVDSETIHRQAPQAATSGAIPKPK